MKKLTILLLSGIIALGTIGCGGTEDEEESNAVAEAALDMAEASSGESAMMATLVAPAAQAAAGGTVTSEEAAAAAEAGGTATLMCPYKGTVTATRSGNEVTFVFKDCTGHCGWVSATGTAVVTYTVTGSSVSATLSAKDFKVNYSTVDIDSSVDYTYTAASASLAITTDASATGPFGRTVTRTGKYNGTVEAAGPCISQSGSWTTTFGVRGYTTTLSNFKRCAAKCPEVGSKLELKGKLGVAGVTIEFTSGNQITWTGSKGATGTLTLPNCPN